MVIVLLMDIANSLLLCLITNYYYAMMVGDTMVDDIYVNTCFCWGDYSF